MKNAIGASNKADVVFNVVENGVSRKVKFTDIQAFATSKGIDLKKVLPLLDKHVWIQKTLLSNFEHMEAFEVLAKAGDNPMVQKVLASEEDFIKFSNDLQFYDGFKNAVKANADASVGAWYMFKSADPSFVPCK